MNSAVSIRETEDARQLGHDASMTCVLEAGTVILDLFYETTIASRMGGRDPMHVLLLTATMAALHGLLNTQSVKQTMGIGVPEGDGEVAGDGVDALAGVGVRLQGAGVGVQGDGEDEYD
jgi:hypothetical protein